MGKIPVGQRGYFCHITDTEEPKHAINKDNIVFWVSEGLIVLCIIGIIIEKLVQ